jgi:hypothetical protein
MRQAVVIVDGRRRRAGSLRVIFTAAIGLSACGEPLYKIELRSLESELTVNRTVVRLQAWLAAETKRDWLDHRPLLDPSSREKWPAPIRELRPLTVWAADDCDGVSVALQRGDHFTLTVCPVGKRPPLTFHVPSRAKPGYLGPFGPDAYISMTER